MHLIGQDFAKTTFLLRMQLILFLENYLSTNLFIASLTRMQKFIESFLLRKLFTFNFPEFSSVIELEMMESLNSAVVLSLVDI